MEFFSYLVHEWWEDRLTDQFFICRIDGVANSVPSMVGLEVEPETYALISENVV